MYNFNNDKIPALFPVSEAGLLKPWFDLSVLDEGLKLIASGHITGFHIVRQAAGALIDEEELVTLTFEKSNTLRQGFMIRSNECSFCGSRAHKTRCAHMAAVAILSLKSTVGGGATPAPLSFQGSTWFTLGNYLYKWLSRSSPTLTRSPAKNGIQWDCSTKDGTIKFHIPESWDRFGALLLGGISHDVPIEPHKKFTLLTNKLLALTISETEQTLKEQGSMSCGLKRETSFWLWLARLMFLAQPTNSVDFKKNSQSPGFLIKNDAENNPCSFSLSPPVKQTWELVTELKDKAKQIYILPKAQECFQVRFTPENSLEIVPSLTLEDGRILDKSPLQSEKYQSAYFLEGEGFLPTTRLPAEGMIQRNSKQNSAAPLLGFMQQEKTRDETFYIAPDDIPEFLDKNRKALLFPLNIVEQEVVKLQFKEMPDSLVIDSFTEEDNWCYLSMHYGLGNTSIHLSDIAAAKKKRLKNLPGKEWLKLEDSPLSWFYDLVEKRYEQERGGSIRLSYREFMSLNALVPELEVTDSRESAKDRIAKVLQSEHWADESTLSIYPSHLRQYQRNGLAWLTMLQTFGIGGILADDMGLGKTHQGLALLLHGAKYDKGQETMLVICPASVVLNWAEKIDNFFKDLDYTVYYGPQRNLDDAMGHRLIVTTYGIARQDNALLSKNNFSIILLDEIQHLKNRSTATHKAVAALNGGIKVGLTGTPVENSLQDLHSLFEICMPGLLGSERQFNKLYVRPITEQNNSKVKARLGRLINPFMLRRTRGQVLTELPETIEDNRICELSYDQVRLYREIIEESEFSAPEEAELDQVSYINILATITRLKRLCCHPCLVQGCTDPTEYSSGKWDLFLELSSELLDSGMKFVVFSQYTTMLELIETHLKTSNIPFAGLQGGDSPQKRQKMIERFNEDPACKVFCASLLAGGVGIDLTQAHAVIHYDRWWNPAKEEQATARVHRMGQKNVVQVFRLITKGTLEEKIHLLIQKKRELASSLIQEDEAGIIKQLDRQQLAELFRFSPG